MSPYETGDICIEPERIAASGSNFIVPEGGTWHTPAADDPAIAASRIACGTAFCIWLAPPMPASTTITSAKNWSSTKASRSGAKPFAVCCARPGSARPVSVAPPPIASAACRALAMAKGCCSTPACTTRSKIASRAYPRLACASRRDGLLPLLTVSLLCRADLFPATSPDRQFLAVGKYDLHETANCFPALARVNGNRDLISRL